MDRNRPGAVMMLSRGLTSTTLTELAKPVFFPAALVYLNWPSGAVAFHSGQGNIVWNSRTWVGVGDFAAMSPPEEALGLVGGECVMRIIGALDDLLDVLDAAVKNRAAEIYTATVTQAAGNTLVGTPSPVFIGYMDGTVLTYGEQSGRMVYGLDLSLASGPGARIGASITHSYEDQIAAFPGDTAGRHTQFAIPGIRSLTWPE